MKNYLEDLDLVLNHLLLASNMAPCPAEGDTKHTYEDSITAKRGSRHGTVIFHSLETSVHAL